MTGGENGAKPELTSVLPVADTDTLTSCNLSGPTLVKMKLLATPLALPNRFTPTLFASGRLTWPPDETTLRIPVVVVVVTPDTVVVFSFLVTIVAPGLCVIFPPD